MTSSPPNSVDRDRLAGCLAFVAEAERLKGTLRMAWTRDGRRESTADHSWRLCLLITTLAPELAAFDIERMLMLAVVHDLGEAIHGDVPATADHDPKARAARERRDFQTLTASLEPERRAMLLALWDEYDGATTAEARLVKGLDKLETIMQHNQGANPPDFDYAFNLAYGRTRTDADPLLSTLRELVDAETRARLTQATGTG